VETVRQLKVLVLSFVSILILQAESRASVSPLQRPAVDVAWFRSEDWSLEVACSVNGCSVNNSVKKEGQRGFSMELFTDHLAQDQCVIDFEKQETRCQADNVDLTVGFNQVSGASLSVVQFDDTAIIEAKDGFGNIVYSNRKNVPFEGCAFHVPENGAYVGVFGSTNYRPFETIIFADGTNKSACDSRPVDQPVKITGTLKSREIQCVSREYSLSLNVSEPEVNSSEGGAPYAYFEQNVVFEIRARNERAAAELGKVLDKPVDSLSIMTKQGRVAVYDTAYGVSVFEPSDADPFLILPSKWVGDFSGTQLPVVVDAKSDADSFYVHIQNAYEGGERYFSDLKFPLQNCTAM